MTIIDITQESSTISLAKDIAKNLKTGSILALVGDLGTGKTFFTKHLIRALLNEEINVVSPTFQLLQIYSAKNFDIYHYDLYRLQNPNEIYELAFEDALNGTNIVIIEWPEIVLDLLPKEIFKIKLSIDHEGKRTAKVEEQ
ncbi:MAG: hypothetical protein RLZZ59_376 [Pseudomonadota bacterium]|jgi:tRNA threonylcarbamoyl adenosine modification protein YjeE